MDNRLNALAVTLLDMYAQAEATLRCAREIHRHVVKLRGERAPGGGQRASIIEKMRSAASEMRTESNAMLPLIRDISRGVDDLE